MFSLITCRCGTESKNTLPGLTNIFSEENLTEVAKCLNAVLPVHREDMCVRLYVQLCVRVSLLLLLLCVCVYNVEARV